MLQATYARRARLDARHHEKTFQTWSERIGVHGEEWAGTALESTGSATADVSGTVAWHARAASAAAKGAAADQADQPMKPVRPARPPRPQAAATAPAAAEKKMVVETQPDSLGTPPDEQTSGLAQGAARLCGAGHRSARFGQDDLVQAARRHTALQRPAAQHAVRRHHGTALPGAWSSPRCAACCGRG